ncbi:MAG: efflux RND transporter permease subunit [Saprospiraceae bacterium]|nr:efflux RND transporter permease subunit [Saprospiraceae bacterium]MCF8249773.1 efflux RND transporter permease subunit [Saprospiraceae bacterium]MCF8279258.1 efflux RND transporter permease subunit [Bacteroidales bacterium]MCF8312806.1 efflux RND transporter permease subunit [Saprospiraceae bacterium]MCF8441253.1 efflux RND transporter permease subunit [Saprospiraceae bacterium]
MTISELSLRRPVLAVVMSILILLFGVLGFQFLGVRDFPAIDPPTVSVRTNYPGANAEIIESQISEPLEKALNSIAGVKNITSSSSQGTSNITVEFELGISLEDAANDVRDKVSGAQRNLPPDLDGPPVVSKADASAVPILSMTVESDIRNQLQLTEFATNTLVERLEAIPGVSGVNIWGEKRYAMRIWMDPSKMSAYGLTPMDVRDALARENVELPSGKIAGNATELTVRTFGRLNTEEEFANLIVKNSAAGEIRMKDIGSAVLGPENEETVLKTSMIPMIAVAVTPQPGSNYVEISDEFYKRVDQLRKEVPEDIKLNIAFDSVRFIKKSISEVEETLLISITLVVLVIFFFFRNALVAFRPLVDIPVSLIGAFFIMYIAGFTINILTLLAIVLATGLVVDDGIVVTENIFKKMEGGMNKWQAAREGSKEIYFAVIATSITLAVIFLPIIFLQGFVGRLFREFGLVVAGAVLISAFVSLTLTPVLNVKMSGSHHGWLWRVTEPFFAGMENGYHWLLKGFMRIRWMAIPVILGCFLSIWKIGGGLKSELAPLEDRSQFRLQMSMPEGTSFDAMDDYIDRMSQFMLDSVPEQKVVMSVTAPGFMGSGSVNQGFVRVVLSEPNERERSQKDIVDMVNRNLGKFTEGRAFAITDQTISANRRGGQPIQFVIQNNNFEKIKTVLPQFLEQANQSSVLQGVDSDVKFNKPELRIKIDRLKATQMGVSVADVSETLQLALSNRRLGYFIKSGKQYQVIGQVARSNRDDPSDLKNIFVRNTQGDPIPLDNLVSIEEETSPPVLYHFDRYKSATISAGLAPGMSVGEGIAEMERIADGLLKDGSWSTALSGTSREFAESQGNTSFAFILALVLIFLVLAAQFESFIDPLVIMLTVPLALAGAVLSLQLFGQTLNIFSQIGMIMLIGLVTKNGILIVEFANKKQKAGMGKMEAVVAASTARMRPIIMTSLAMSLGALPIAMSLGAAATSRIPLGIVIVGGILFSLVLTLFVIPAMYSFLSRKQQKGYEELVGDLKGEEKAVTLQENKQP